jgi:hypothetical protein
VISIKACLEGGNLVNLTIHAPWYIMGCPLTSYQTTCKDKHGGGAAKVLFCRNIMEACEAREYEWVKAKTSSGRNNNASEGVDENVWKVLAVTKQQSKHERTWKDKSHIQLFVCVL